MSAKCHVWDGSELARDIFTFAELVAAAMCSLLSSSSMPRRPTGATMQNSAQWARDRIDHSSLVICVILCPSTDLF